MARRLRPLFTTLEADEPDRVERTVGRLRVAVALCALIAFRVEWTQPVANARTAYAILGAYFLATLPLLALSSGRRAHAQGRLAIASHIVDLTGAAAITLVTDGVNSPLFLVLTFPLVTAAYRWGTAETLFTAAAALVVLAGGAALAGTTLPLPALLAGPVPAKRFITRSAYLVIAAIAVGYLADSERRRRHESAAVADLIRAARLDAGLTGTLQGLLLGIASIFESPRALLVAQETQSRRTFLLDVQAVPSAASQPTMSSSELDPAVQPVYLFPSPGHAWWAVDLSPLEGTAITVVNEHGETVEQPVVSIPETFRARHPFRTLMLVTVHIDDDWTGRLMLVDPIVALHGHETLRFAQRLVRDIGPAVRQVSVLRRLRRRAERIERLRLARDLHDGPIQTLSAALLRLQVLRTRLGASSASADITEIETLLRDEIGNLRDMTQDMRLAFLECDSSDFVHDCSAAIDRFRRQTAGIDAHLVSDAERFTMSSTCRREVLRILHEALVNVRKHSGAHDVLVWLREFDTGMIMSIEDNGRGFPFEGTLSARELAACDAGPVVIRERVAGLGGELWVDSRPGRGARLEIRVPLAARHHAPI